jgi:hypothetical protein
MTTIIISEWLGIIASLSTIISLTINIFQWRSSVNLKKQIHSKVFSEWNNMFRIAELADDSRSIFNDHSKTETQRLHDIIRKIEQCTGIADSSRQELLAFSEKYLGKPISRQHPANPDSNVS